MHLIESISSNAALLAVANIVAVIAAAAIVFKVIKYIINFLKSIYKTNVKAAILKLKRSSFYRSYWCAKDIFFYVSYIFQRSATLLMNVMIIIVINDPNVKSRQEFIDNPPHLTSMNYEEYRYFAEGARMFFVTAQGILFIYAAFICFRLIWVSHNVVRLRWRWERRAQLAASFQRNANGPGN